MPPQDRFEGEVDLDLQLNVSSNLPAFLYPCQIETRLFNQNRTLKIRIYPDQIAISRIEKQLSEQEFNNGRRYHNAVDAVEPARQKLVDEYGDDRSALIIEKTENVETYSEFENDIIEQEFLDGRAYHDAKNEPRAIWGKLAQDYGTHRAAWIIQNTQGVTEITEFRNPEALREPEIELLPNFFLVTLYPDQGDPLRKWTKVSSPLKVMTIRAEGILTEEAAWVADFEIAKEKGMAVEFQLADEINKISKITVVGVNDGNDGATLLENLLENHHYTVGNGFPKYGTPTNNSATAPAGFTKKEKIEARFEQEFGEQPDDSEDCNADQLARVLGFSDAGKELITKWQYGWKKHDYYTEDLHRALWRVTGGYFLHNFIGGAIDHTTEARMRAHFEDYVRPGGKLPSFRIGNLPYGVLPATQFEGWKSTKLDSKHLSEDSSEESQWNKFDKEFHNILRRFYTLWEQSAEDPADVPRIGDTQNQDAHPEEDLVRILAMSASSRNYSLRPYVDDRLIGWFLDQLKPTLFSFLSGTQTPEESAREWVDIWRGLQVELVGFLEALGISQGTIESSRLMETIAWGDSKSLDIPLVSSESNPNDNPDNYIPLLDILGIKASRNASETLLFSLLHRALAHEMDHKPWKLLQRDEEETEQKILEFFNNVTDPQEIVDRIVDDPKYRLKVPRRVYGVRPTLAKRIIETRDSLENNQFTGIEQIDEIRRVGVDTLRDIIFSFSTKVDAIDYEAMLKGVIDLFTHRLDAWISSLASKRLDSMRRRTPEGLIIGAYGYVENLPISFPENGPDRLATGGYIHAPSVNQATTVALLKSGFLTHLGEGNNPYRINLSSDRIRRGISILQGVREGQELGALLGYQFERDLHERRLDQYKDEFREAFPLVAHRETQNDDDAPAETVAARNVVNGLSLVKAFEDANVDLVDKIADVLSDEHGDPEAMEIAQTIVGDPGVVESIRLLREAMDGIADLLIHESVYQVVVDNYERSGAAMDAAAGIGIPPELESMTTPLASDDLGHKVFVIFDDTSDTFDQDLPRERAEPRLATWFQKMLGDMSEIGCCVRYHEMNAGDETTTQKSDVVTLDQLGFGPLDFLYLSVNRPGVGETELEQRIKTVIKARRSNLVEEVVVGEGEKRRVEQKPIEIDFGPYENNPYQPPAGSSYVRSLNDAIEMAQQVLTTLSQAMPIQPDKLSHPDDELEVSFAQEDYDSLLSRASAARDSLSDQMQTAQNYVVPLIHLERTGLALESVNGVMERPEEILAQPGDLHEQTSIAIEGQLLKHLESIDTFKDALVAGIETKLADLIENNPEKTPEELIELGSKDILDLVGEQLQALLVVVFESTTVDDDGNAQPMFDEDLAEILDQSDSLLSGLSACFEYIETQTKDALAQLFRFGIVISRHAVLTAEWLQGRVEVANERLQKADLHLGLANSYQTQAQAEAQIEKEQEDGKAKEKMAQSIDALVRAIKALFGENFVVLPTFTLPDGDKFKKYMGAQDKVLKSKLASRIYLWFQQGAQTHMGVQRLEDMLLLTEVWHGSAILKPYVIQLPYQMEEDNLRDSLGWQALSDNELGVEHEPTAELEDREQTIREKRPRGTMSLAVITEGEIDSDKVCGLLVDDWTERLPHGTVDTAIALHADTPNQQPPNCCLLAVPGDRKHNRRWTPGELEAIVGDTLDLARVRAVDLDALPDLKGLLPALLLPISPDQDFFEEELLLTALTELPLFKLSPDEDG